MGQISIILPTYNVEKYIARALDSCIHQTFKDIEIIVVDDLGNDKSIDIAKEYASKDKRIKIIHNKENLKLLRARYEGVKAAGGGYIMFLDPDDYLELNACEECIKILMTRSNIDLLFCDALILNYNDTLKKTLSFNSNLYNKKDFIFNLIKTKNLFWTMWAKVIKKDLYLNAFKSLNLDEQIKINMAEDALLYYPLVCLAKNIYYLNKNQYYHNNINYDSITKKQKYKKQNLDELQFVIEILNKIKFKDKNLALLNLVNYYLYTQKLIYEKEFLGKEKFTTIFLIKAKKYLFKLYRIPYILIIKYFH